MSDLKQLLAAAEQQLKNVAFQQVLHEQQAAQLKELSLKIIGRIETLQELIAAIPVVAAG